VLILMSKDATRAHVENVCRRIQELNLVPH